VVCDAVQQRLWLLWREPGTAGAHAVTETGTGA